jgi:hypothetical protein
MLFRQNNICMGAALGSQYRYRAMTLAVEILIAQLPSQSKLTTAWHENWKIRCENELLKAKEPAPDVYKWKIYWMTPKNIPGYHKISWDYKKL